MADFKKLRDMLGVISQLESSGGKNIAHPTIETGLQEGQTAIGNYGLLPNTVREVLNSMKHRGAPIPPELQNTLPLTDKGLAGKLIEKPELQNAVAGDLMSRVLNRSGGDEDKAAYMWNTGHNLDPNSITPEKLDTNPYVEKFRKLRAQLGSE